MRRIAIIDDDRDNRMLVRALLDEMYELVEYSSGRDALDALPAAGVALVLLDISLPDLDGREVVRHLRASEPLRHLPAIALTAHAMTGDRERLLAAGFDDYLCKPITDDRLLLDTLARWLEPSPET